MLQKYMRSAAYYLILILIYVMVNVTLVSNLGMHIIQCRAAEYYLMGSSISNN